MKKERLGLMGEGDDWVESDISSSGSKKVDFRGVSRLLKGSWWWSGLRDFLGLPSPSS